MVDQIARMHSIFSSDAFQSALATLAVAAAKGLMIRVKICCIKDVEEAALAVSAGAHALGLVSHMPSGPGVIDEARIREIADGVPPGVSSFLLTSRTDPDEIYEQHRRCRTHVIQLCDRLATDDLRAVRARLPGVRLIQVLHVEGPESVAHAARVNGLVDGLLLDSGRPAARVRELGGTGRVHDWSVSARIVHQSAVPVYLAGGLNPHNVGEAIRAVRPFGVDLCTGIRRGGVLDPALLASFMEAVRDA